MEKGNHMEMHSRYSPFLFLVSRTSHWLEIGESLHRESETQEGASIGMAFEGFFSETSQPQHTKGKPTTEMLHSCPELPVSFSVHHFKKLDRKSYWCWQYQCCYPETIVYNVKKSTSIVVGYSAILCVFENQNS